MKGYSYKSMCMNYEVQYQHIEEHDPVPSSFEAGRMWQDITIKGLSHFLLFIFDYGYCSEYIYIMM